MLQPIKNFLTYLQKSANSSTLFGLSSNMSETNSQEHQQESPPSIRAATEAGSAGESLAPPLTSHDQNKNELKVIDDESKPKDKIRVIAVEDERSTECSETDNRNLESSSNHEEEAKLETRNDENSKKVEDKKDEITKLDEENSKLESDENSKLENDEDSKLDYEESKLEEKNYPSVERKVPAEVEIEDSTDGFSINEIILNEGEEHNTSLTDPGSDPLAIEDYQADISNNNSLLGNSTPSVDLDTSAEEPEETIIIIDVDDIKENDRLTEENHCNFDDNCTNSEGDEHREELFEAPRLPLEDLTEEQEIRSDGSDSGLGSEISGLQTTISSTVATPVCKFPSRSNLKRRAEGIISISEKKMKRAIHFDEVKVYYFPRMQGFACVPSQGGCTLGMGARHTHFKSFTLAEHASEQRRMHKQQMQEINPRGSSSEETDSDEELSEASGSDLDADANGFLQPVPARQRRAILKAAGIRKIDSTEKDECRAIRSSREFCGCSCRGYCDPDTCSCSQAGIKCQVDRPSFPCGCTRDGCANVVGRIEFNPNRVRTHFIHTIMRLELENKEKTSTDMNSPPPPGSSILSYGNNCAPNNGAISVTATNNCSNNTNSLSNMCNYQLSNMNHTRPQQHYGQIQMQQHNQSYMGSNQSHNSIYPNVLQNGLMTENCALSQITQHHADIVNNGCDDVMNVGSGVMNGSSNVSQPNQQMNMSYNSFRDISTDSTMCSPRADGSNSSMMMDYQADSNQLYNGSYSNQSFLSQSYHNPMLNSNSNYHCSLPSYSNYQQHYIAYASSSNCINDSMEIHDLTSTDDEASSYISLHPPTANSSRLDAINDLLQNNRNTLPTAPSITSSALPEPVPMKPMSVSPTVQPISMASSGQTSTSVRDGTSTTISTGEDNYVNQLSTSNSRRGFVNQNEKESKVSNNSSGDFTSWSQITSTTQSECKILISKDYEKVNGTETSSSEKINDQTDKSYLSKTSQLKSHRTDDKIERKGHETKDALNDNEILCNSDFAKNSILTDVNSNSKDCIGETKSNHTVSSWPAEDDIKINDTALINDEKVGVDSVRDTVLLVTENVNFEQSTPSSSPSTSISSKPMCVSPAHEVDENLTEIIKKSIVETVSA